MTTHPRVTAIRVDQATKKVYVSLQADASSLFPSILRGVVVNGEGKRKRGWEAADCCARREIGKHQRSQEVGYDSFEIMRRLKKQ